MGYDEGFAHNMARVHGLLLVSPGARILVVAEPDHLCSACPHLAPDRDGGAGYALGGDLHEGEMRMQDGEVAARLGIAPGDVLEWKEILDRIAVRIDPRDLPAICTTCPWLPAGVCAEGIAALSTEEEVLAGDAPGDPEKGIP
jgi:hypothetical protein